jgi:hypothetical protein
VRIQRGDQGQSPAILHLPRDAATRELPDLSDAGTWAHAQVACDAREQIVGTLATRPDRTLSRLLAPRRLLPNRAYAAAVVPAYLSGRLAGLGEDPTSHPAIVTGLEPAWRADDIPDRLPVYYTWSFQTGAAGDFEALAKRLQPVQLDPKAEATALHLSLPNGDTPPVVDWEAPLRVAGQVTKRPRRPAAAVNQIRRVLRTSVNPPVLGPSYFGEPWIGDRPLTPSTSWAPELNVTPMFRAAAGLGADVVRAEQDALIAAAKVQLDAFKQTQRQGRRKQLATAFVNRVAHRIALAPAGERARVNAPIAARQSAAADVGVYSLAGRRVVRKVWRGTSRGPVPIPAPVPGPVVEFIPAVVPAPTEIHPPVVPPPGPVLEFIPAVVLAPTEIHPPVVPPPPPEPMDADAVPTGAFAPRFSRPMSEPLAERFPELMLPGLGSVPSEGVALVESNPAFVEGFLVGANQELNYELLWRGLPTDRQATAFRRFWGHSGDHNDIDHLSTWTPTSSMGSHIVNSVSMVLVVRGELVRRYPSMLIAALPATWNTNGSRSPVDDANQMTLPAFRGRIGEDVLYAGFATLTASDVVGTPKPSGPAGFFFLLSENPGDPRFGLDPEGTGAPTRATLSWTHLTLPADAPYATLASFPNVPDAGFTPSSATAATMASLVRQRPFRVFLHASLLVRLGA